jgi:hypothetical protein
MKPKGNEAGLTRRWQPGSKKVKDLRICSWNVLNLYRPRAVKMLLDELNGYNTDITAIQEVRWTETGMIEKETVLYSTAAAITNVSLELDL